MPTSYRYANLYSSDPEDEPLFEELIDCKTVKPINTYYVVPLSKTLISTPHKVLKKQHKTRRWTQLATIKQEQSDTTSSDRFLLTALHSVSQAIIHAHTDKIALYNNTNTA